MRALRPLLLSALLLASAAAADAVVPDGAAATLRFVHGSVEAVAPDGTRRALAVGAPVTAGERLVTAPQTWADFDFADGGRVLLQPLTEFAVEEFRLPPVAPAADVPRESAVFRLLKGSFRTVTGLIGRSDRSRYAVRTGVATLGVRGTEYEVRLCQGDCADDDGQTAVEDGLYLSVARGRVALSNETGELLTDAGRSAFVRDAQSAIRRLEQRPRFMERGDVTPEVAGKLKRALRTRYELRLKLTRNPLRAVPRPPRKAIDPTR